IDMVFANAIVPEGDTDAEPLVAACLLDRLRPTQIAYLGESDRALLTLGGSLQVIESSEAPLDRTNGIAPGHRGESIQRHVGGEVKTARALKHDLTTGVTDDLPHGLLGGLVAVKQVDQDMPPSFGFMFVSPQTFIAKAGGNSVREHVGVEPVG